MADLVDDAAKALRDNYNRFYAPGMTLEQATGHMNAVLLALERSGYRFSYGTQPPPLGGGGAGYEVWVQGRSGCGPWLRTEGGAGGPAVFGQYDTSNDIKKAP